LSESFGFTQADVDQMLKDADLESQSAEIKAWYDGYHFGDADIYCPWDVISYLRDFQYGVAQKPKSYCTAHSKDFPQRSVDNRRSGFLQYAEQ